MVCVFIGITLVFGWLSGAAVIRPPAILPGPQKSPRPPRHAPLRATSGRRLSVLSAEHPVVRLPPVHHTGAVEAGPPPPHTGGTPPRDEPGGPKAVRRGGEDRARDGDRRPRLRPCDDRPRIFIAGRLQLHARECFPQQQKTTHIIKSSETLPDQTGHKNITTVADTAASKEQDSRGKVPPRATNVHGRRWLPKEKLPH